VAVPIRLVVDEDAIRPPPRPGVGKPADGKPVEEVVDEDEEESIDPDELVDADAVVGSAVERITEAFPGVSVVESD
jgi:hypothetical protein